MKEMSFVVIDEFDAFYHYELAEAVVRRLIALDNKIKSLADRTTKALRQAHNLQKMYKAGAFDEK